MVGIFGCSTFVKSFVHIPLSHSAGLSVWSASALALRLCVWVTSFSFSVSLAGHCQ